MGWNKGLQGAWQPAQAKESGLPMARTEWDHLRLPEAEVRAQSDAVRWKEAGWSLVSRDT